MHAIPRGLAAVSLPSTLRVFALLALLLSLPAVASHARIRDGYTATPKAYIYVIADSLDLAWNGDQGEAGRGNGEVYLFTLVSWTAAAELRDPQKSEKRRVFRNPQCEL